MKVFHIHSGKTFFGISRDDCNEIWFELSVIVKINKLMFIILYRTDRLFPQLFHLNWQHQIKSKVHFFDRQTRQIINYDFPVFMSDYIHRAGRVGRVGSPNGCMIINYVVRYWDVELLWKIEVIRIITGTVALFNLLFFFYILLL